MKTCVMFVNKQSCSIRSESVNSQQMKRMFEKKIKKSGFEMDGCNYWNEIILNVHIFIEQDVFKNTAVKKRFSFSTSILIIKIHYLNKISKFIEKFI